MAARNDTCDCNVIHQEILDRVQKKLPAETTFAQLHGFFKMFGDNTRLRIMWALGVSEMCVCDLAVLLGMTKSAISHQLRTLKEAGLVKFRKDGKIVFYSLADDHVKIVLEQGLTHIEEL
ncbi:MAG: ArsR/SmtB family transcription factor [Oscillospiraceae bacterium]